MTDSDLQIADSPAAAAGRGDSTAPLLETKGLTKHFRVGRGMSPKLLHAADDVNIVINSHEIVALAGESGSGKSTIARLLGRVHKPTSGEIYYQGRSLSSMRSRRDLLRYRADVPMVFQDPFSSLNPAFRASHGIARSLKLHRARSQQRTTQGRGRAGDRRRRPHSCRRHHAALSL